MRLSLEEPTTEGGEYRLIIENIREIQGRFAEVINIKTTSDVQPDMRIYVYGNILAQETPTEDASQPKTEG